MPLFIKGIYSNKLLDYTTILDNDENDTSLHNPMISDILAETINYNNPILTPYSTIVAEDKWTGGVLAPNGNIYCAPLKRNQVLEINTNHISKNPNLCFSAYFNKL